ncbi:MAG: class I SAM-dependent methyltransferase [Geobacteraceae bacterium]|nr:class I SAM-dependent methyltransferase [Geobacteraceae bacterium]NTW79377.1 class I SAM-dependent methyltransferase [Geobacteraceae bacterium]
MSDQIQTIFNSEKNVSSNAEEFYRNYWSESGIVRKETTLKNRAIIDKFFPQGLTGKKILEIGVGGEGGILLELMHSNDVFGVDVSDSAINNCRRFGIDVIKANLDCDSIPFQDNFFDVVFAFEVFEHFASPQHALEEIRRVLKPGGVFICSFPSTFTYHWPRLFYPELFEMDNFKEFLMINEFRVTGLNDWMMHNNYGLYNVNPEIKSWSLYCHAEKLGSADAPIYLEIGRYFWEKRNENGFRTRPIEAIDMFRKSYELDSNDDTSMLCFSHAMVYRFINNDQKEFLQLLDVIFERLKNPDGKNKIECLARMLLIDVEARRLGFSVFKQNEFEMLKQQLAQAEGALPYIEEIGREESVNQRLAALA